MALEGGQGISFAVSVPETAFGVDKPATKFDNRRSVMYSSLLLLSNRNLQEWPNTISVLFGKLRGHFFTPKNLQTPHCSQTKWLKKLNQLILPISERFHLFPTGFQFFGKRVDPLLVLNIHNYGHYCLFKICTVE